jgi:acyl-CoA synthetase (AMP-forming)/AMP-acid ligase II
VTGAGERSLGAVTATLTAPGQLFEIDEAVVRGVTVRVWKSAPASLRDVLELSRAHGDVDFLVYEGERTTFAGHYRAAATLARRLRDECGVVKGDRVAIAMRNLPEWIVAFWAATCIGAIAVPLNAWWTTPELSFGLRDSGSTVLFADRERAERVRPALSRLTDLRSMIVVDEDRSGTGESGGVASDGGVTAPIERAYPDLLGEVPPDAELPEAAIDPDDDATIFYTSGTTGHPKGAVGTHRNSATNLMSLFFLSTANELRFGSPLTGAQGSQSVFLLSVPLFHATGCQAIMMSYAAMGGRLVMMHHFDPVRALELIEREGVTNFGGVPSMVMQVIDAPELTRHDVSTVRGISYGGAPAPPELVRRIRQTFPDAQASNGYGLTETTATTTLNSSDDYVRKPDSVGRPVPVCEVAVVAEDYTGDEPDPHTERGPEVTGELWVKGPQVVRGYWNRPDETARTFTTGWLHTGDVARIDEEGFVYIVDRAKDVVIRGGENVYSAEVEGALFEHPAVADCAVIGIPHPVLGEEVGAVIVLRPGTKVTAEELAAHVRRRLAAFNVPTRFSFRDRRLPRNPAGKVLKRELREEETRRPRHA